MERLSVNRTEGILITLVGIIGVIKVQDSLSDAGEMIERMLYILFFIYLAIILIGIKVIRDSY